MKNQKVSIIIPTFNEEQNISTCLESLLNQSYKDFEIIVVDDGSTDQTKEIVKTLSAKLITQSHLGPAKARNLGAKESKGDILVFMDADMIFEKDFIGDLVKPILKKKYKGTFSKNEFVANWKNKWARCWNINLNLPSKRMIPEDYPEEGQDFRAILKKEFIKVGGFNDTGYTDTWTLSEKLGYKPRVVEGAKYFHSNPETLGEVFIQAKWRSKREYKFGFLGKIITLIRVSLPVSIILGVIKSLRYKELRFIIFKIIYDLGQFLGILEMTFKGKLSK